MRLMSIVTASVVLGATTPLSLMRASAQNCVAGSSTSTGTFTWTYEPGSNRKSSLAYPNGATVSWAYNNRGELTSVQNRHADGSAISTYDYTYDAAGRRISKNDERYGYNARSELTQATSISDANFHAAYQFDDIGNRETSAEFGIRSGEYTYTANELNQYASIVDENSSDSAGPSDATFTPTYDADGNQTLVKTRTGIWQVTCNAENRPVKWTCGTTNLVMAFDRMGRRVLSEVQVNDAPIKTETYVYDGYTCILRQTTIHTNSTPTVVRDTFVWDPTEPVATRPLVWNRVEEKGSTRVTHPTAFYFHDGNKNLSDVVSSTDETKAHYTYAPFGDSFATGSLAEANPWRFSSEYADDELGCVYYNYRYYEPVTGRWLSRDPIVLQEQYLFNLNGCNSFDYIGLVVFEKNCNEIENLCKKDIEEILQLLDNFLRQRKQDPNTHKPYSDDEYRRNTSNYKTEMIAGIFGNRHLRVPDAWSAANWSSTIRRIIDDLQKDHGPKVDCCPTKGPGYGNPCSDPDENGYLPGGGYLRPLSMSEAGYDYFKPYRGKIVICPPVIKDKFVSVGGCGCLLVHELMHKNGIDLSKDEFKKVKNEYENTMIVLARYLLGRMCKGYDQE